jgi:EAL domain-containing protein (putative c-di-GMP-specific phosphodiesterase class I)
MMHDVERAVVELGHILGLRVVGEGVAQPGQIAALRQMGCALGQGFHFARPLDPPDIELLLPLPRCLREPGAPQPGRSTISL